MSNLGLAAKVDQLAEVKSKLPLGKQDFAQSLISQFMDKGRLSEKQKPWVDTLIELATNPPAPPKAVDIGFSVAGIIALFETAAQKLKRPRIRLQPVDVYLELHRLTSKSMYPGDIAVKTEHSQETGSKYAGRYLGRVTQDGKFVPRKETLDDFPFLPDFLSQFAATPASIAAEFGRLTGDCAFCRSKLTDVRSTAVGYGKVCAGHYGLPYPTMSELKKQGKL